MIKFYEKYRFLFLRRFSQILILVLYIAGNHYGLNILLGNLSSSVLFGVIPLSDPYAVLQIFATGTVLAFDALLGASLIAIIYGLFLGRSFCSWICPMNMITDLANLIRRVFQLDKDTKKISISRSIRYWIIALSLILSAIFGVAAFELINPVSMLYRGVIFGMGFGWAAVIVVFIFDLFVQKNGFCGHICPIGGFYSLISRFTLMRVKHDHQNCTLCMKCKVICPENQVLYMIGKESVFVLNGECTNCGRCIEVCDDDSLEFGIRNFIKVEDKNKGVANGYA